jgi:hypothetical protein
VAACNKGKAPDESPSLPLVDIVLTQELDKAESKVRSTLWVGPGRRGKRETWCEVLAWCSVSHAARQSFVPSP